MPIYSKRARSAQVSIDEAHHGLWSIIVEVTQGLSSSEVLISYNQGIMIVGLTTYISYWKVIPKNQRGIII